MDELKQKAIKRHYANLVDCMNSLRVMDRLGHLLSLEEMDLIRKLQFTHQERTRELIAILLRKNEELRPFDCFIEALEDTDENHKTIAEAILKTYVCHLLVSSKCCKTFLTTAENMTMVLLSLRGAQERRFQMLEKLNTICKSLNSH
uniref:CARD domain-containing protein n=1 Tax=Plectus sambesii TaxID=2011161 RepID=A0A914X0B3_9BILA